MTSITHRKIFLLTVLASFIILLPGQSFCQVYTSSHVVTVVVQPVTVIQVNVGSINLNITGANAIAGQDEMTVIDQSSILLWGTNSSMQKITIKTDIATPIFVTKVVALNPGVGTAAPEVTLSTIAQDFVLNIGRSSGSSILQYTGIALASQGTGTDSHIITFTVQAQ